MGLRFIFMLTRNDRTVADAATHLETALSLGVRHIGFKDVGLPVAELKALNAAIKAKGATSYLEVRGASALLSVSRTNHRASERIGRLDRRDRGQRARPSLARWGAWAGSPCLSLP